MASNILQTYSPKIPRDSIIIPNESNNSMTIEVYPSTSILPNNLNINTTKIHINEHKNDNIPIPNINLIGT